MIVGRRRRLFDKMAAEEKAQEQQIITRKAPALKIQLSPSIPRLLKERELMMAAFRKGLAPAIPKYETVKLLQEPDVEFFDRKDKFYGRHWLADFVISDAVKKKIQNSENPAEYIKNMVRGAARHAKAHILNEMSFQQLPDGNIVGLVVIQESHLSIHCLLNQNLAAVDVFTCGAINFGASVDFFAACLGDKNGPARPVSSIEVKRGVVKDHRFIQGMGVQQDDFIHFLRKTRHVATTPSLGRHIMIELYLCNPMVLDDKAFVQKTFREAICKGGGRFVGDFAHQFQPQGVSNATIGKGRFDMASGGYCDLTVHDYPEVQVVNFGSYAAVDLCDFTNSINLSEVLKYVVKKLEAQKFSAHVFLRGKYALDHNNKKVFLSDDENTVDQKLLINHKRRR